MTGYKLITIGGAERPLKFGTNQTARYCELRSITLAQYYEELADIENSAGSTIRDLIYSALWAGAKTDKLDVDFDAFAVGNWMDDIQPEELAKVFDTLTDSNDDGKKQGEATGKK